MLCAMQTSAIRMPKEGELPSKGSFALTVGNLGYQKQGLFGHEIGAGYSSRSVFHLELSAGHVPLLRLRALSETGLDGHLEYFLSRLSQLLRPSKLRACHFTKSRANSLADGVAVQWVG
jgi:hypothetical protein